MFNMETWPKMSLQLFPLCSVLTAVRWFHMSYPDLIWCWLRPPCLVWSVSLRLRQLDIEFMKRLSHSVNIIPIIAKADTMTIEERQEFKQRVSVPACVGSLHFMMHCSHLETNYFKIWSLHFSISVFVGALTAIVSQRLTLVCVVGEEGAGDERHWVLPPERIWWGHGGQERQR